MSIRHLTPVVIIITYTVIFYSFVYMKTHTIRYLKQQLYVTGRGLILVVSLKDNHLAFDELQRLDNVHYLGEDYTLLGVEAQRTLTTHPVIKDTVGLVVCEQMQWD